MRCNSSPHGEVRFFSASNHEGVAWCALVQPCPPRKFIDSFLFESMTSPAFQPKQSMMRSVFDIADLATTGLVAGGVAARMTKTTKTA
jgi:hypothetical protein